MLEAPRELLDRALLPLYPLEPPLKPPLPLDMPLLFPLLLGTLRLPMRSAPPLFAAPPARLETLAPLPPRFPELTPEVPARLDTPALLPPLDGPPAGRVLAVGPPRLEPPYFLEVALSP